MTADVASVDNMKQLSRCRFIVWTQAGYKKVCKIMSGEAEVHGYPVVYPSLVTFSRQYVGYHYYRATCTPLHAAIEDAKAFHQLLLDTDAEHQSQLSTRTSK